MLELTFGLQWFLAGAIFWFGQTLPPGGSFAKFYSFADSGMWLCVILGSMWGMRKLKERVIAPRAGYVALEDSAPVRLGASSSGAKLEITSARRAIMMGMGMVACLGILMLSLTWKSYPNIAPDDWQRWSRMIGIAIPIAATMYITWAALRYKAPRYLWLAGLSVGLAAWMFLTRAPFERTSVMLTWWGGGLAVIGAIRLRSFLAANPRPGHSGE